MLELHIVFFATEPPQDNVAIRIPTGDVFGEFIDLEQAILTATAAAPNFPNATWIVIEDDLNNEFARLFLVNGTWELQLPQVP